MSDEIDHIEELQKHLYARDPENVPKQKYGILRPIRQNVVSAWGDKEIPKQKMSHRGTYRYKKFFIFSLVFFLLAAGLAVYSVFHGAVTLSSRNVSISILGNSFVAAGEDLPLQIEIANKNSSDLVNAELAVSYPKGASDETGSDTARMVENLGTIPSGKTKSSSFSVVLYGQQGIARTVSATLSYRLPNSTATFQKTQTFTVTINSSPVSLIVDGPSVAAANQTFTLTIRTSFSGDQPLENGIVRVEYPSGYTFLSAIPAPVNARNAWTLGTLEKGAEQTITVTGKLSGVEGDERSFRVYFGSPLNNTDYRIATVYNSALHTVTIEKPFIAADIFINGENADVATVPIGATVDGRIQWRNSTNLNLADPQFVLSLSGTNIDMQTVSAEDAYVDLLNHSITWNSNSDSTLSMIPPGGSGTLLFSFTPKSGDHSDGNLSLSVEAVIPELENQQKTITNLEAIIVRYIASIQFAAQALYAAGPIKNTGPFPPRANRETTYTITWTARPTNNPLTNVVAKATLPAGIVWAGVVVPKTENVTYNPDSRVVMWNAGSLPKATNIPLSKSVSFQIKAKPTASQIGTEIMLLSQTALSATDASANAPLSATRPELTTRLDSDPSYTLDGGRVLP